MNERQRTRPIIVIAVAAVLTAAAIIVIAWTRLPLGVPGQWTWPRVGGAVWDRLWYPGGIFIILIVLARVGWHKIADARRMERGAAVFFLVFAGLLLHLSVAHLGKGSLLESMFAIGVPKTNVYYTHSFTVTNLGEFVGTYHESLASGELESQLSTHPPAPVAFYVAIRTLFASDRRLPVRFMGYVKHLSPVPVEILEIREAAQIIAASEVERATMWAASFVLRLAACLVVVPLYLLGRELFGPRVGWAAAVLVLLLPSYHLFSPTMDQLFPLFAATFVWLGCTALRRPSVVRGFLSGVVLFIAMQFSLVFLIFVPLAIALGMLVREEDSTVSRRAIVRGIIAGAVGFVLSIAAAYVTLGENAPAIWLACLRNNAVFNETTHRSYWAWLLVNPVDFAVFLGVPLVCFGALRLRDEVRLSDARRVPVALVLIALLAVVSVAGVNRGEVARLWMPLMPFAVLAGAAALPRFSGAACKVFVAVCIIEFVQTAVFKLHLDVLGLYQ